MTATQPRTAVAPARRNRRTGRKRGGGAKALSLAAGLLLVGGAMGVQTLHMSEGEFSNPLTYAGDKGEAVDARRFTVRVDSVTSAKSIQSNTKTIGTDNLFLIVSASAKSSLKPYHLAQPVLLTADGKEFDATDRVDNSVTLTNTWVQPDIWVSGRFFFEVPPSALSGASVVFGLPRPIIQEGFPPEVEIDLGLDEAAARKLTASPQDVYSTDKK
ncbi:hypothetical protein [Nonomuraea basaltis]|uniref:hypothetical protein n=1 Tax=Nonomuraea basaltis TaxID=2495887 RepID=UPI00110C6729|nr:hypothetical protein [Nonomuraea basaltis]TMR88389.1 hypothetical protein EJK15_66535 [Nonomuraea basaltis]